jgi:hypothetical protein
MVAGRLVVPRDLGFEARQQFIVAARAAMASAPDSALCTQVATSEGVPEQRRLDSLQVPPQRRFAVGWREGSV